MDDHQSARLTVYSREQLAKRVLEQGLTVWERADLAPQPAAPAHIERPDRAGGSPFFNIRWPGWQGPPLPELEKVTGEASVYLDRLREYVIAQGITL